MFRISVIDSSHQRTLVLEGKLDRPWTGEVESTWSSARNQLRGRKLVIDVKNLTFISPDGEKTLLKLRKDGARFSCGGVLTRHILRRLARECGKV
jgi:anti-anti-sigma regulatory factor